MNRRALLPISAFLILAFVFTIPAFAYYSSLTGELRDSVTGELWTHGATVEVLQCPPVNAPVASVPVDNSGTFTIGLPDDFSGDVMLCVRVVFNDAPNGTPATMMKGPFLNTPDEEGELDTGVYFANTGPNAVTLQRVEASADSGFPAIGLLGVVVLGGLSFAGLRRRRIARRESFLR
jgi:hypothetical protein